MLTLTRKTEYALIAMCHLARVGQNVVSARDIAEEHHVPLPLLMNVLKKLNRTGYINSVRGARGGYVLVAKPEELTLAKLIEAVEGPVHLTRCTNPDSAGRKCDLTHCCPVRDSLVKVHHKLRHFLADITLAELAFGQAERATLDSPRMMAE